MGRLFAGTPWDRPPTCERCGKPESECACAPVVAEPRRLDPAKQSPRLRLEKRPRRKVVTVVHALDAGGNDLEELAATLKAKCGTGGTVKEGKIELQGDHVAAAEAALIELGFAKARRG